MTLHPCEQCHRHIDARETTCPFCGTANITLPTAAPRVLRASRAAVFAGLTACWTGSDAPRQTPIDPPRRTEPAAPMTPILSGTIVDDMSGQPVAGVSVELVGQDGVSVGTTRTNSKGQYRFDSAKAGDYILRVRYGNRRGMGIVAHEVQVTDKPERYDLAISTFEPSNIPKPYGAPPARRRIV